MRHFHCQAEECEAANQKFCSSFFAPSPQRDIKTECNPGLKMEQLNSVWFQSMKHAKMESEKRGARLAAGVPNHSWVLFQGKCYRASAELGKVSVILTPLASLLFVVRRTWRNGL